MIANEDAVIADSLWNATANTTPACPPLQGESEADVAVIGAGYTGLSAALFLAERGLKVVLLEAETPGWGASGRNGGQVVPVLKESPERTEAKLGTDFGGRMVRMAAGATDLVFSLIKRHKIDCDAVRTGWIRAAYNQRALKDLAWIAAQWQKRGQQQRFLDADDARLMIGSGYYCGGLLDPRGGTVHPLNYALGLADAAIRAGAVLHGHTRALRIEQTSGRQVIHTQSGAVRAGKVLLCSNGYTDAVMSPLMRTVVPVRSVQVATDPLPDDIRASIFPGRQASSDTRRVEPYFRLDAQGRFILGGRGTYRAQSTTRQLAGLRRLSLKMFPQLEGAAWRHAWGGFVAITTDHYPHLNRLDNGVMAGLGYNGRGVAMATAMGKVMANWASGVPESELDFPVTTARPIGFHRFYKTGVAAAIAKARLLDATGF